MNNNFFNEYPYTDFHELNLSWIIKELREFATTLEQFVSINALKYADPIQWNITSQYEKNTIVIDPLTGTAYISVQPVPSGVAITNTDYWTVVFDLGSFVVRAAKNFTDKWEPETTLTATFPSNINDWIIWGDTLYRVLSPIVAGDQYVDGSNIVHFTAEDVIGHIQDLNTTDKSNLVAAINELLTTLQNTTGDLQDLNTTDKSNLVAAINEIVSALNIAINDIDTLDTITSEHTKEISGLISLNSRRLWSMKMGPDKVNQSFVIINDNYWLLYEDLTTGNFGIDIYDPDRNFISNHEYNYTVHPNAATVIDDTLYVIDSDHSDIYLIDINNFTITVNSDFQSYAINSITTQDDNLYIQGAAGGVRTLYICDKNLNIQDSVILESILSNADTVNQGIFIYKDLIYVASNRPNALAVYDLTGTCISVIQLPEGNEAYPYGELETFYVYNDEIYMLTGVYLFVESILRHYDQLFITNLNTPLRNQNEIGQGSQEPIIMRCLAGSTAINPDGSTGNEFGCLFEAAYTFQYRTVFGKPFDRVSISGTFTDDVFLLMNCNVSITGSGKIPYLRATNCSLITENISYGYMVADNSISYLKGTGFNTLFIQGGVVYCNEVLFTDDMYITENAFIHGDYRNTGTGTLHVGSARTDNMIFRLSGTIPITITLDALFKYFYLNGKQTNIVFHGLDSSTLSNFTFTATLSTGDKTDLSNNTPVTKKRVLILNASDLPVFVPITITLNGDGTIGITKGTAKNLDGTNYTGSLNGLYLTNVSFEQVST